LILNDFQSFLLINNSQLAPLPSEGDLKNLIGTGNHVRLEGGHNKLRASTLMSGQWIVMAS